MTRCCLPSPLLRWLLYVAFAGTFSLPTQACAPVGDPSFLIQREPREGEGERGYRVGFDVSCDGCSVSWEVSHYSGQATADRGWETSIWVSASDSSSTVAILTAVPPPGAGPVDWVRISVGGKVVAFERGTSQTDPGGKGQGVPLSVSTPIPPGSP